MDHVEVEISGKTVLVDAADWERAKWLRWSINAGGYVRHGQKAGEKFKGVLLHRFILGTVPEGMVVDHVNRNPLDNRRSNLRLVTQSENCRNSRKRRGATSTHKGVSKTGDRWQVVIRIGGKLKNLGKYETEAEAAAVAAPYFDNAEHQPLKYGIGG